MFVVFLNGPPRSGKDSLGNYLENVIDGARCIKFAAPLKQGTHALYGLWDAAKNSEAYEDQKDIDLPDFLGLTPRQAYIEVSERHMKRLHGADVYGRMLLRHILKNIETQGWIVTDSGFLDEAFPIIRAVGIERCFQIRIRAEERGCFFKGDSRGYWEVPGLSSVDLTNDGDPSAFFKEAEDWLLPRVSKWRS